MGVNSENEPLVGISPVRLLFERSLQLHCDKNVRLLQYLIFGDIERENWW